MLVMTDTTVLYPVNSPVCYKIKKLSLLDLVLLMCFKFDEILDRIYCVMEKSFVVSVKSVISLCVHVTVESLLEQMYSL